MEHQMTLAQLLLALEMQEKEPERYSKADRERVRYFLLDKIDHWRIHLDEREHEALRHRVYAKEHSDAARILENQLERSKEWLTRLMQEKGFEKLSGNEWQVSLRKSERLKIEGDIEPTEEMADLFPSYVATKFSWKKSALKQAVEAERCPLTFVHIEQHFEPNFKPRGK